MADSSLAQDSSSLPPRCRRKPRKRPRKSKMSPHRAQQDLVGGPLSGAQVARSNETVNFLLGNRRPAWMTSQNEQASRSPHTNKGPTSRSRQGVQGFPMAPAQAPRKESSTNASNSPSVPGTVATSAFRLRPYDNLQDKSTAALESNQLITYFPYPISSSGIPQSFPSPTTPQPSLTFSSGSDCAAALPSPAPTDQPSPPIVTSNQTSHQIRETCLQSPELGLDLAANNSNATTAWTGETRALQRPANVLAQDLSGAGSGDAVPDLSNPTPLSTNLHSTSRFTLFEPSEHPALFTPSITLPEKSPSSVSLPLVPDSQAAHSPTLNLSSRPSSAQKSRPAANASPLVAGHPTPQTPGERQDGNSHAGQSAGTSRDPLDSFRQIVMANNLDSYISDRGGMAKLPEDGTTAPRVRLLKDAIEKADYFYIVLHQILCLWTLDTKAAHHLLGLPPDVTESALGIVQNVLRKNENMGHDTIFFFANFPASSASGLWHTEAYRNHIGEISRFLNNLHEQWNRILVPAMRPHTGRGYPILADELRYQLKLRSPILETIFFTVTRRHTGVPDGPIADQMNALFRQDSQNDQTQIPATVEASQPTPTESAPDPNRLASLPQHAVATCCENGTDSGADISSYQLLQQARDAEQRRARSRQLDTAQNQAHATTQPQTTSVAPPRAQLLHHHHHHHSSPRPQGMQQGPSRGASVRTPQMQQQPSPQTVASTSHASPRGLGITQAAPSTQTTRPPSASFRPTRDAAGRLIGNLFRSPNVSIPLDRIPHTPWEPKAVGIALHQVQLRSPRRVPRELPRSEDQSKPVRFYQSIKELALGPIATPAKNCVHRLAFVVPDEHFNKLCPTSNLLGDCVPVSEYFEGSLRYRLRLCELPVSPDEPANISESVWAVAQSYWPEHIAIMVNDNVVAVRRKQHNGQHLPVELTPYILPGTNSISVSISPKPAAQKPNMMYFMAVEVVETLSHDNIVNMVMSQGTISADTTKQVIRSRLEPVSSDGDDELVVVGSDLSIDLADPFSATIFKIPARGVSCTHMECFDLINWLETRPVKPRCTAHGAGDACRICNRGTEGRPEPSLVDKWKCPLCDGDARPYSLRVDRFMGDVRKSLEAEGKLHTKTIYVRADGMWKAKEEEADDDEEENVENRQPPAKRAKTRPSIPEPEIIELD
ncbi:MIZ/SP-RING zinc finger [Colletotrichum fioriniae PJ7]|uniref:MIZ/SP-RING zinc finger n=1 Tax=Colletotrichum fioriniae PJ7 TaxID=1445577 RepID=A0A010S1N9_9PEZI|nr:MIZ/SP-RING zinc finger [Colletotrichum fioriniae PJ7]